MIHRNPLWIASAIWCGLAVALGAFGAHGLKPLLESLSDDQSFRSLANWETASRYQLMHGLGGLLAALAAWMQESGASGQKGISRAKIGNESRWFQRAGVTMLLGSLIFSGCLYLMVALGIRWLGAVVPIGGLLMLAGWGMMAFAGWNLTGSPTSNSESS